MCVTNTTHRRSQAISLNSAQLGGVPSVLSQRLLGGFAATLPTAAPKSVVAQQSEYAAVAAAATANPVPTLVPLPEKTKPKRRRKPQKPGKTAKLNDRHFVVHNYHDHANDLCEGDNADEESRRRGGVAIAFPLKLHAVLDQVEADGLGHILSWQPHGRCFVVHNPKEFVDHVMPRYFRQTKLTSFQRQLNLYGFSRITRGPDAGGYYHELFLRGKIFLCKKMGRTKVKGTKFKAASSPDQEPDFYKMKPVVVSPHPSSDEEMSFDSNRSHEIPHVAHPATLQQNPSLEQPHAALQHTGLSLDPLPIQYEQQQAPTLALSALQQYQRQQPAPTAQLFPEEAVADKIFDEAVDELFLDDGAGGELNLAEFVQDWDPNVNMEPVLQDDAQLGFLLEKLLEE